MDSYQLTIFILISDAETKIQSVKIKFHKYLNIEFPVKFTVPPPKTTTTNKQTNKKLQAVAARRSLQKYGDNVSSITGWHIGICIFHNL